MNITKKANNKFSNLPIDEDTRVFNRKVGTADDRDVCVEHWSWDGIHGTSVIFIAERVQTLSDHELELIARRLIGADKSYLATVKRDCDGYVFCNLVKPEEN